jgi:putative endonuclease
MKFYVYILYSEAFDKFYVGQTDNIETRVFRHNAGMEKFTLAYRPWILKWFVEKQTRADAVRLEIKLKNLSKDRLKVFIVKYS